MFMPDYSPWGDIQHADELYTGVHFVSTASHGGVMMLRQIVENLLDKQVQDYGFWFGNYLCFEEDADENIVLRELLDQNLWQIPDRIKDRAAFEANIDLNIQTYHPDYWQAREKRMAFVAKQTKSRTSQPQR